MLAGPQADLLLQVAGRLTGSRQPRRLRCARRRAIVEGVDQHLVRRLAVFVQPVAAQMWLDRVGESAITAGTFLAIPRVEPPSGGSSPDSRNGDDALTESAVGDDVAGVVEGHEQSIVRGLGVLLLAAHAVRATSVDVRLLQPVTQRLLGGSSTPPV
jgi:hypothetical protein